MEIRDPVHGSIHILDEEIPIIENRVFQRLRGIKQLGLSEYVFPGATHTRYLHSLGVFYIADSAFTALFKEQAEKREFLRLKETLKLAALLHDIGHAPLSHSTEIVMPPLDTLSLPKAYLKNRNSKAKAIHEDYTVKSIIDSSLTDSFKKVTKKFGVIPSRVAELVTGSTSDPSYFTVKNINYFPLLHQLVSSEMDCDRMDYLLRDSYFCGVSYGHFDLDWILDNIEICSIDGEAYLGITERAVSTFDDFLLGRFHMFLMVYFHYKAVCMEKMLLRFFETSNEYSIPSKVEDYIEHDDHYLMKTLRSSNNRYAKEIIRGQIPPKIFECFGPENKHIITEIEAYLASNHIEFIHCSSKGRLSKYYQTGKKSIDYPLKVVRKFHDLKAFINISDATNLYQKYSHAHSVKRLHCYLDQTTQKQREEIFSIIKKSSGQVK